MPSHWLPLFLQLEQPPGNDEKGFTGLRGDKLVGEAEAVTVDPPEPGRFDAATPGFAGNSHPTGVILKLFGGRTYNLQKWADELQSGINRL